MIDDDYEPLDIDKLVEEAMKPLRKMTNEGYKEYVKNVKKKKLN